MKNWLYVVFTVLVSIFLLSACGNQNEEKPTVKDVDPTPQQEAKPALDVKAEASGNQATIFIDTDLIISEEHKGQSKVSGEGHIHMYVDNGEKVIVMNVPTVLKDLEPGNHKVKLSLHNNDHTPYDVTKTIEIEIN